ncbi:hypothetical protein SAMN05216328_14522 [Ensifer sp. YR511]|nr:hypothetical protein SAMN05216328_14522 [Ensifer sp. YR511]
MKCVLILDGEASMKQRTAHDYSQHQVIAGRNDAGAVRLLATSMPDLLLLICL